MIDLFRLKNQLKNYLANVYKNYCINFFDFDFKNLIFIKIFSNPIAKNKDKNIIDGTKYLSFIPTELIAQSNKIKERKRNDRLKFFFKLKLITPITQTKYIKKL
jgi:hypothetical protein